MNLIFETENFRVRRLKAADLEAFHEMQGNEDVMRFVRGKAMTFDEDKKELQKLITSYDDPENDFWIFAVELKEPAIFVGTVALVKSEAHGVVTNVDRLILNIKDDQCEIGYRLLQKYWGKGYAKEIAAGLIAYARKIGFKSLIACAAEENIASLKILNGLGFQWVEDFVAPNLNIPEQKLILQL